MLPIFNSEVSYGSSCVCVLACGLSAALTGAVVASGLVPFFAFLLKRWGQAQQAQLSAEASLARRLPRLSSRLHGLVGRRAETCACATLARGEKPEGSPQKHRHRRVRLSQPPVHVLREHGSSRPRLGRRRQTWPSRADPEVSVSGLPYHVHLQAQHAPLPPENPLAAGRHGPVCPG